jgi:hypothetical protein
VSIALTVAFEADVDAQAGAYATGILAMMVSGAAAVAITARRRRQHGATVGCTVLTLVLLCALAENVREKPDGLAIAALFVLGVVAVPLVSRVARTIELRADAIEFDETARRFVTDTITNDGRLTIIANQRRPATRPSTSTRRRPSGR